MLELELEQNWNKKRFLNFWDLEIQVLYFPQYFKNEIKYITKHDIYIYGTAPLAQYSKISNNEI